jgi:hypothetical protein
MGLNYSIPVSKQDRDCYQYDRKMEQYIVSGNFTKIRKRLQAKNTYGWTLRRAIEVSREPYCRKDMIGKKSGGVLVTTLWDKLYEIHYTPKITPTKITPKITPTKTTPTKTTRTTPTIAPQTDNPPPYADNPPPYVSI